MLFLARGGIIWHFLWLLPKCGSHFRVPNVSAGSAWVGNSLVVPTLGSACFPGAVKNSTSLCSWISHQELRFLVLGALKGHLQLLSVGGGNTSCRNQGFQNGTGIHVAAAASCLFKQGKQSNLRIKTTSAFHLLDHAPGVLWEGIKGKKQNIYLKKKKNPKPH